MLDISIIITGEIHRDPAIMQMLKANAEKINGLKIPLIFCEEDSQECTIDTRIDGNRTFIKQNTAILTLRPQLRDLLKISTSGRKYFPLSAINQIHETLAQTFSPQSSRSIANGLIRMARWEESLALSLSLKHMSIPYFALDLLNDKRQSNSCEEYLTLEQRRIECMTDGVITKGIADLVKQSSNGIIIIPCGMNHAHRLAANLQARIASNKEFSKAVRIRLFTSIIFSSYVQDGEQEHKHALQETRKKDSADILRLYDSIECKYVFATEDEHGTFACPAFDKTVDDAVRNVLTRFSIPKFNQVKRQLIEDFGGRVSNLDKKGTAEIEVMSSKLKKDVREILGLDRKTVTLAYQAIEIDRLLTFIKGERAITLEAAQGKNKFLITYSLDRESFVMDTCMKWRECEERLTTFKAKLEVSPVLKSCFERIQGNWRNKYQAKKAAAEAAPSAKA